ncbi:MAG: calcium-binding protein [Pseudorhodoplanes sp.]|uniref:calcium-binding protein n=1 Tax=Pseudorhodoplanes sp. TaxID=1934341 RepID=UPI003D0DA8CA
MTTVNFNLSSALQTTLAGAGNDTYVYAFAFGSATSGGTVDLVTSATLFEKGAISATSIDVTAGSFYSGDIYVVIQQNGDGNLLKEISSISDVINNAASKNYSYQLFEATLSGSQYDLGDISAVNTFGFTSTYEVVYQNGSDTRGFSTSGSDIFAALPADAVSDFSPNAFPDPEMLATGPATADNASPWPSSVWQTYINSLKANAAALAEIKIVYSFGGSPLQADAMLSQYGVQYVTKDAYGEDYFWLVPDTSNGATNTDWIRIPAADLAQNIFVQGGSLEVHQGSKSGKVVTYDSFTPNNADGGVAKHFVAGFDAGFWGSSGTSPNSLDTTQLNFNKGYNWSVNYAYDAILLDGVGAASFTNNVKPANPSGGDFFYDPWAQQFVGNSNAYGYSYSDLVSTGGVNPQIALWDSVAGANVETINITLYDTGETPSTGYKATSSGWIAPDAGGYKAATTANTNQIGFDFNFSVGSTIYAPDDDTPIVLKIYAPQAPGADADGFISLDVTGGVGAGDWFYYIIQPDATNTWSFQVSNATGESGFFNIQNLPGTADGSVSWYQLVFGDATAQSIYNIYATTDVGGGITDLVVDHGIEITENPNGSYTLAFAPGGHMFYDIDTFAAPPTEHANSAGATVIGSKKADFVNALNSVGDQQRPTSGADTIFGHHGYDQLSGLAGNDTIDGGKGVDFLRGGDGDDILQVRGKEGIHDMFDGGSGTDTLQFLGDGSVTLAGFDARASSIEALEGNGRGLFGTGDMDVFDLSALSAMTGLPFIDAKGGNDILIGSAFADDLRGGAHDDILDGRGGNDILDGGGGFNIYVFGDGYGSDTVVRFNAGKDVFDFRGVSGVSSFADLVLTEIDRKTVLIDFDDVPGGDTLTVHKTTIEILTANQGDFLFA